jgi:hypothetical protein
MAVGEVWYGVSNCIDLHGRTVRGCAIAVLFESCLDQLQTISGAGETVSMLTSKFAVGFVVLIID